jgi:hypothetical protein
MNRYLKVIVVLSLATCASVAAAFAFGSGHLAAQIVLYVLPITFPPMLALFFCSWAIATDLNDPTASAS